MRRKTYILYAKSNKKNGSSAKRHKVSTVKHGRTVFYLKEDLDKAIAERNARVTMAIPSGYYSIDQLSEKYGIPHKQVENGANAQKIPFIVAGGVTYYDKRASDVFFSHEERQYEVIEWLTGEEVDKQYGFTSPQSRNIFGSSAFLVGQPAGAVTVSSFIPSRRSLKYSSSR